MFVIKSEEKGYYLEHTYLHDEINEIKYVQTASEAKAFYLKDKATNLVKQILDETTISIGKVIEVPDKKTV